MSTWYEALATAMKRRDVALNGLARWQVKLAEAEAEIATLTQQQSAGFVSPVATEPAAVAETEAAPVAADYADSAE